MRDLYYRDDQPFVQDLINDPVSTLPHTIPLLTRKLFATMAAWIVGEVINVKMFSRTSIKAR